MGCLLSTRCSNERHRKHTIGDLLDEDFASLVRPYILATLQSYFTTLQGQDGFLLDSRGERLRFDPDNQPTPPQGRGVQLSFKTLPHHGTRANTPVPVYGVDQFALLFCREFLKTKSVKIETADSSSLLNVLVRASCFPPAVRAAAAAVRDEVRNQWAHTSRGTWTWETFNGCLDIIMDLVIQLPKSRSLVQKINNTQQ